MTLTEPRLLKRSVSAWTAPSTTLTWGSRMLRSSPGVSALR